MPTPAGGPHPEAARALARRLARQALAAALAHELGCAAHDFAITDRRGEAPRAVPQAGCAPALAARLAATGLSISHAPGLSLVAWHPAGPVGVDVQALSEAEAIAPEDQARLAALYLGPDSIPDQAAALSRQAQAAINTIVFAHHWATHEARLKCLGEPLREWSPALHARLLACRASAIALPGVARWAAAVAWRAQKA